MQAVTQLPADPMGPSLSASTPAVTSENLLPPSSPPKQHEPSTSPGTNHKPTGTSAQFASELRQPCHHAAAYHGLSSCGILAPL
jgi:hypothetical protein